MQKDVEISVNQIIIKKKQEWKELTLQRTNMVGNINNW